MYSFYKKIYLPAFLLLAFCCAQLKAQENTSNWFPFQAKEDFSPSVIDMSSWLDAPAGKHGFVKQKGGSFVFEDGTPIKFWGVNIASVWPFVENGEAIRWAQYLAKYGVNSVRFHKFTDPALTGNTSTVLDEKMFKNFDFFSSELKKRGIYYGWSHIYGHKPMPGDKNRLLAYDEVVNAGEGHLKGSTIGLVNFAPDLQDLSIELTVNMLNHQNPYTGLKYANDPALSFVELQNEDNIFFPTALDWVQASPTYKKLFCKQFSDWLTKKYKTKEGLLAAWGEGGFNAWPDLQKDEDLDKENILPVAHFGYLNNVEKMPWAKQRIYDTGLFLYETQNKFYSKYIDSIRKTGYRGTIVTSCWQAGQGFTHYYNLHSDYKFGFIDRHNYFGGRGGHALAPGKFDNKSMLNSPGSGLLSTGLQAVNDRPFALSEWMAMQPTEWTAESAPIVAVYGMGLQGWDASYVYASNQAKVTSTVQAPRHGVYNSDSPLQIGLYPALARMIYRGDIKEAPPVSVRNVYVPGLANGKLGFSEKVTQNKDVKSFDRDIPLAVLAAGKVVVTFTKKPTETKRVDLSPYQNKETQTIASNTGQLKWQYDGSKGLFTVNTPGTKGIVGFAGMNPYKFGDVTIKVDNPFAVVLLTSLDKKKSIVQSNHFLITTVARARNTGMKYNTSKTELLEVGESPILMEPVIAELLLKKGEKGRVYVLDHAGRRTEISFPFNKNISLDGDKYKTLYYEVVLQ